MVSTPFWYSLGRSGAARTFLALPAALSAAGIRNRRSVDNHLGQCHYRLHPQQCRNDMGVEAPPTSPAPPALQPTRGGPAWAPGAPRRRSPRQGYARRQFTKSGAIRSSTAKRSEGISGTAGDVLGPSHIFCFVPVGENITDDGDALIAVGNPRRPAEINSRSTTSSRVPRRSAIHGGEKKAETAPIRGPTMWPQSESAASADPGHPATAHRHRETEW